MLVWVKEYINKNFATCKSLCNLQEPYTTFKEKYLNVNIGFSKFFAQRLKCCVLAGSKMTHSVLRLQCSSKCCAACRCNRRRLDIERPEQINFALLDVFPFKLFPITFISPLFTRAFFTCNITSSPYVEMLPIRIFKNYCSYFFSGIAMFDVDSCNLWRLKQQGTFIIKNILIVPSSYS